MLSYASEPHKDRKKCVSKTRFIRLSIDSWMNCIVNPVSPFLPDHSEQGLDNYEEGFLCHHTKSQMRWSLRLIPAQTFQVRCMICNHTLGLVISWHVYVPLSVSVYPPHTTHIHIYLCTCVWLCIIYSTTSSSLLFLLVSHNYHRIVSNIPLDNCWTCKDDTV